jgi:hypothetical protein
VLLGHVEDHALGHGEHLAGEVAREAECRPGILRVARHQVALDVKRPPRG